MAGAWCGGNGDADDARRSTLYCTVRAARPRSLALPLRRIARMANSAARRRGRGLVTLEFRMRAVRCWREALLAWLDQRRTIPFCGPCAVTLAVAPLGAGARRIGATPAAFFLARAFVSWH